MYKKPSKRLKSFRFATTAFANDIHVPHCSLETSLERILHGTKLGRAQLYNVRLLSSNEEFAQQCLTHCNTCYTPTPSDLV